MIVTMCDPIKIIAVVILLSVVTMFTGVDSVISDASVAKAEKSCCGDCPHDEDQDSPASPSVPQSAPCCPAVMCLSFDIVEPFTLQVVSSETVPFVSFISEPIPDPFIKSIYRPPTLV